MHDHGITVLGAGSWGTALAIRLATNQNATCLWGHEAAFMAMLSRERQNPQYLPDFHFPENLSIETRLVTAVQANRDLLIVVPSHAFREVLTKLAPYLDEKSRIAWGHQGPGTR